MKSSRNILCFILCVLVILAAAAFLPEHGSSAFADVICYRYQRWSFRTDGNTATILGYYLDDLLPAHQDIIDEQTSITIPSVVYYNGQALPVTALEYDASLTTYGRFHNLETIIIPSSVVLIGTKAFNGLTSLRAVQFQGTSSLTTIGNYAFHSCTSLTRFDFPVSLTTIGNSAFTNTRITNINLSSTHVTQIGWLAFSWGGSNAPTGTQIAFPTSIQSVGTSCFDGRGTVEGTYPGSAGQWAQVTIDSSNTNLHVTCQGVTPTPTVTSSTSYYKTTNNAEVRAVFTASAVGTWTTTGVRLYNSNGTVIASKEEYPKWTMSRLEAWYDIQNELDYTLSPNTNYSFEIYTYYNGTRYTTNRTYFKTDIQTQFTWTNTIESISEDWMEFTFRGQANTKGVFTAYGYTFWNMETGSQLYARTITNDPNLNIQGADYLQINHWHCETTLKPDTSYAYQLYYQFSGVWYYSDVYTFRTLDTTKPHGYYTYTYNTDDRPNGKDHDGYNLCSFGNDNVGITRVHVYIQCLKNNMVKEFDTPFEPVSDPSEMVHVYFRLDVADFNYARNCDYEVKVTYYDRVGNSDSWGKETYHIEDIPPEVRSAEITEETADGCTVVFNLYDSEKLNMSNVRIGAWYEGLGRDSIQWKQGRCQSWQYADDGSSTGSGSYTLNWDEWGFTESGWYTIEIVATDIFSNYSEPAVLRICLDQTPPQITSFQAEDQGSCLILRCSATDNQSLQSVRFAACLAEDIHNEQALVWYDATISDGYAEAVAQWPDAGSGASVLLVWIYAYDSMGNQAQMTDPKVLIRPGRNVLRLPEQLTKIEEEALSGLAIDYVIIPSNCTVIGDNAFANCSGLRYIYIPASVQSIGTNALGNAIVLYDIGSYAEEYAHQNGLTCFLR